MLFVEAVGVCDDRFCVACSLGGDICKSKRVSGIETPDEDS